MTRDFTPSASLYDETESRVVPLLPVLALESSFVSFEAWRSRPPNWGRGWMLTREVL